MLSPAVWISQLACRRRQPHPVAADARRGRVGVRARRPFGPGRRCLPLPKLPAQHLAENFGGEPSGSKKCVPSK